MPKISIVGDEELIAALTADPDFPSDDRMRVRGRVAESERLGSTLGDVETMVCHIAAGIDAIVIARHLLAAARHRKAARSATLEIASPTGRVEVKLDGASEDEVEALVRSVLPFTR